MFPSSIFFNHTPNTEIYTLSLHDALPISSKRIVSKRLKSQCAIGRRKSRPRELIAIWRRANAMKNARAFSCAWRKQKRDRKSTRLNSSHTVISYAVFCLKKKKQKHNRQEK